MAIVPPLVAALVCLAIAPGLLFYFDVTPKVSILILGVSMALIPATRHLSHLWRRRHGAWFAALLALQLVSLLPATVFSTNPALSAGGGNWRRFGLFTQAALLLFALLSAASLAAHPRRLVVWLRLFCVAGVLAALYGCAQYAGIDPWLPASGYRVGEGEWTIVRPPSTLGHASYAATFYLHAIFAGLALFLADAGNQAGRLWRRLGLATAGLASIALVLGGTRAAILGLFAGLAVLAFLLRPGIRRAHLAGVALVLIAGGAFYFSPPGQKLRSRTRWYLEDPRGGARLMLWRDAASMGASRWLAGWGLEVFPAEFPRYQSRELARAFPDFYHESPHNIFLDVWIAQGLPGLAVMLGLCALALRSLRRSRVESAMCAGLLAALIAQQFTCFTVATALCFYFTVAMLVALDPPRDSPRVVRIPMLALVPVVLVLGWYAIAIVVSDRLLDTTARHLASGQLGQASATYELARKWQPPGVSSDLWYSRRMVEAAGRSQRIVEGAAALRLAVAAAERATTNAEDRHNAFYNLASIQAAMNDPAKVESNLRLAIAAAPNWFKPHWTLARLLALSERRSEAEAEAGRAVDLDGGVHPEVVRTLDAIRSKD